MKGFGWALVATTTGLGAYLGHAVAVASGRVLGLVGAMGCALVLGLVLGTLVAVWAVKGVLANRPVVAEEEPSTPSTASTPSTTKEPKS